MVPARTLLHAVVALALLVLGVAQAVAQSARTRVALVVGVSAYKHAPALLNPGNDARAMAAALARLGFEVDTVLDPDRAALEAAVRRLGQKARGADAAAVFYAGHALEVGGRNWLLPTGADPMTERDLRFEALDLDSLLEQLDGGARLSVVMLDACRDNPFRLRFAAGTRGGGAGGLAPARAGVGTLVAFATAPGTVASDGAAGNSPFTAALLRRIETPGLEVRQLMAEVRRDVREATRGQQVPWEHSALEGEFFFKPAAVVAAVPAPAVPLPPPAPAPSRGGSDETERLFWLSVRDSTDPADMRAYLARFPDGIFAELTRNRLARMALVAPPAPTPSPAPAPAPALEPLADRLAQALDRTGDLAAAPYAKGWNRNDARLFAGVEGARAMAVEVASGRTYRSWPAPSMAVAEQLALEGCQLMTAAACIILASGDNIQSADPRSLAATAMPRLAYAGPFRVDMVPLVRPGAEPDAVKGYGGTAGFKALAVRASGAAFMVGAGATQAAADAAALAKCNALGSAYPCILYASGNQVVLPQRRTEAARP